MYELKKFFSWWKNKFIRSGSVGKVLFILVNLFLFALLLSFPIIWSIPDPKTEHARDERSEIYLHINGWNSRLDELDLELYAELETADTTNPQPYQDVVKAFNDLENDSLRLKRLEASFEGETIGYKSGTLFKPTKKWQDYLDQVKSNKDQRTLLEEAKREIARERGGLVHSTPIDTLWNERLTITSKIESEKVLLEAAEQKVDKAEDTPWGTVKKIYNIFCVGFLILIILVIFTAITER